MNTHIHEVQTSKRIVYTVGTIDQSYQSLGEILSIDKVMLLTKIKTKRLTDTEIKEIHFKVTGKQKTAIIHYKHIIGVYYI